MGQRNNRKTVAVRKPFQGILNIITFNWHFYAIYGILFIGLAIASLGLPLHYRPYFSIGLFLFAAPIAISILVSYYIYDHSDLYELNWLPQLNGKKALNVNAGFDETSEIIKSTYPETQLHICDFYDPKKHTEISIKIARRMYPPDLSTQPVNTTSLPYPNHHFDYIFAIFSVHEIRNETERMIFLKELGRIVKPDGKIFLTEHLRDFNNFTAYTIGFLHFYSRSNWTRVIKKAGLSIKKEAKFTPFISIFTLEPHGDSF